MKKSKRILFVVMLLLIAGTASAVTWIKTHKQLGKPGIRSTPLPGTIVVDIDLPQEVLNFTPTSRTNLPQDKTVLDYLPKDTSFGHRIYIAQDGFPIRANIILMGQDRTSIHKAEYCLAGSGWNVDERATSTISVGGPTPYPLEVARWTVSRSIKDPNGKMVTEHGLYMFWFVADGETTPSYGKYKLWLMWDMLRTATLQRWAFVSFFSPCGGGQDRVTAERMEKFIAAIVPEFQLPPAQVLASATTTP